MNEETAKKIQRYYDTFRLVMIIMMVGLLMYYTL